MTTSETENFPHYCAKKSFEVSYALLRIAESLRPRSRLGDHLEDQAFELIKSASTEDYIGARKVLRALRWFIKLGTDAGSLHPSHSSVVSSEVERLDSAIAEFGSVAKIPGFTIEDIFTGRDESYGNVEPENHQGDSPRYSPGQEGHESGNPAIPQTGNPAMSHQNMEDGNSATLARTGNNQVDYEEKEIEFVNAMVAAEPSALFQGYVGEPRDENLTERQSAIFEKIRQTGNCLFRDIQEAFPGISERTVRYDIYRLIETGYVERVGNGGPGSAYRARPTHFA